MLRTSLRWDGIEEEEEADWSHMSEGTYYENPRGRAYTTAMGMETGDVTDDEDEGLHDAFDARE